MQEALELIQQLKLAGVRFVILSGGEPLLREDIFSVAKALKTEGIHTNLFINGLLVREFIMGISVDGTQEVHDLFRVRKSSFKESLDSIRLCLSEGIRVGLRFTLSEGTKSSLPFIFDQRSTYLTSCTPEEKNFPL
ncbi:radical SAM protein [Thermocrinis minervae]|uniref:radical SAM protein n=1 Tax=Thermocrinis minervae TaxID=381751 RepID=UPI001E4D8A04|nr:radical SAM protein [Thermocrinis minervae]